MNIFGLVNLIVANSSDTGFQCENNIVKLYNKENIETLANISSNGPLINQEYSRKTKEIVIEGQWFKNDSSIWETDLSYIEYITIKNTSIETLPATFFCQFLKLKKVIITNNYLLKTLPTSFYQLKYLKELKVDNNILLKIPNNFHTIEKLDLSNNRKSLFIKKLINFETLTNLTYLNLSHNRIAYFPTKEIGLNNLEVLDLSYNNIKKFPSLFANCITLKILRLSNNKISTLNNEFYTLFNNLETLDLSYNRLIDFANRSFATLNKPALLPKKCLLTSVNYTKNILSIPTRNYIWTLRSNLKHINLSNNRLTKTPNWLKSLQKLCTLDLSSNTIKQFTCYSNSFYCLKSLNLSKNMFTSVPVTLTRANNLGTLNISNNNITTLPKFQLPISCKTLDISHNDILSFTNISNITSLKTLNVSNNKIKLISSDLLCMKKLKQLDISNNLISSYSNILNKMRSLQVLVAYNNTIEIDESQFKNIKVINSDPTKKNK